MKSLRIAVLLACVLLLGFGAPAQVTVRNSVSLANTGGSVAYSAGSTYAKGDAVTSGGSVYISLIGNNIGNTPASNPSDWQLLRGSGGWGNGEIAMTTPALSAFTPLNFAAGTTDGAIGAIGISMTDSGSTGAVDVVRALVQPIPTPASLWTAIARIRSSSVFAPYITIGIVMYDSVGGKAIVYGMSAAVGPLGLVYFNSVSSWSGQTGLNANNVGPNGWLKVQFDGTNLNYYWSQDGNAWFRYGVFGITAFFANNPDHIGIGMNANNNSGAANSSNPWNMQCFSWTLTQP